MCRCAGYQQIIESIQAAAAIHRGDAELAPAASGAHPDPHQVVQKNRQCLRAMRGDFLMSGGYKQQPGKGSGEIRKDGKEGWKTKFWSTRFRRF